MGETTNPTWTCLHCGVESPIVESHSGPDGCIAALRARLSAAERERDAFRERLLGRANEEPPSGWLRPGEGGYENTPEGARQARDAAIRDRDAAFARGVEAAAALVKPCEIQASDHDEALEDSVRRDLYERIRALAPAPRCEEGDMTMHTCHAHGCSTRVPPAMFMCRPHWYSLPEPVRDAIWREYRPGQEDDKAPSVRYLAVQRFAVGRAAFKKNDEAAARISAAYIAQAERYRQLAIDAGDGDPLTGLLP